MSHFRPCDRETPYLLPPSLDDWLPKGHLARFVADIVDRLDLSALICRYRGAGSAAYHPAMLLALLIYGYAAFGRYRMKLLKLGTVALDGTKVHANASRHSALSYGHAEKIEAQLQLEVAELLARAEAADAEPLPEGLDLPEELARREARLKGIGEAKAEIEARAAQRFAREQADYEAKVKAREERSERTGQKPRGTPPAIDPIIIISPSPAASMTARPTMVALSTCAAAVPFNLSSTGC